MACVAHPALAQIFTYRACKLKLATGRKVQAVITKGRREKRKRRFDGTYARSATTSNGLWPGSSSTGAADLKEELNFKGVSGSHKKSTSGSTLLPVVRKKRLIRRKLPC